MITIDESCCTSASRLQSWSELCLIIASCSAPTWWPSGHFVTSNSSPAEWSPQALAPLGTGDSGRWIEAFSLTGTGWLLLWCSSNRKLILGLHLTPGKRHHSNWLLLFLLQLAFPVRGASQQVTSCRAQTEAVILIVEMNGHREGLTLTQEAFARLRSFDRANSDELVQSKRDPLTRRALAPSHLCR